MDAYQTLFDKLLYQFRDSPNILQVITAFSEPIQDTLDVLDYIETNLDIDVADGTMLDKLGSILGVKRPPRQETRIFTLCKLGEVLPPWQGFADTSDPSVTVGGYLTTTRGLVDQSDPDAMMADKDFRYLIRQKAKALRRLMTYDNLASYMVAFGHRAKIDDSGDLVVVIDPFDAPDEWTRWYIENRGFSPVGIKIVLQDPLRDGEVI
jgi:hypothetical protein